MSSNSSTRSNRTKRLGFMYDLLGYIVALDQLKPGKAPSPMGSKIAQILQPKNLHLQNYSTRMQFNSHGKTWKNKDAILEHGQIEAITKRISDPDRLAWFLFGYTKKNVKKLGEINTRSDAVKMINAFNRRTKSQRKAVRKLIKSRRSPAFSVAQNTLPSFPNLNESIRNPKPLNGPKMFHDVTPDSFNGIKEFYDVNSNQGQAVSEVRQGGLHNMNRSFRNSTRKAKKRSMSRR